MGIEGVARYRVRFGERTAGSPSPRPITSRHDLTTQRAYQRAKVESRPSKPRMMTRPRLVGFPAPGGMTKPRSSGGPAQSVRPRRGWGTALRI